MMSDNVNHIITRLKLQPRHGGVTEDELNKETAKQRRKNQAQNTGAGTDLSAMYTELISLTDQLASSEIARATGIQKLIGVQQSYAAGITAAVDAATKLEQRNTGLQKSYGLTTEKASKLGFLLDGIAVKMGTGRTNIEKYSKSLTKLSSGYLISRNNVTAYGDVLLKNQRYLTDIVGVSEAAAEGLQGFAALSGNDVEQTNLSLAAQAGTIEKITGQQGVQKQILEEIGALSAETQLQFSRMPSTLGLAVMKMNQMGLSMDQLSKTGDSLLNIESSVGDEMELQLLTGQRLVKNGKSLTNQYRAQMLAGNAEGMAQTLADAYETQKASLKTNMIARKQYEKLFGLEEGSVAKMIQKEEIISKLQTDDATKKSLLGLTGDDFKAAVEDAKKNGKLDIDVETAKSIDDLMKLSDNRDTATRTAEALERIEVKGITAQFTDGKGFPDLITNVQNAFVGKNGITEQFQTAMKPFEKFIEGNAETVGAAQQFKSAATTFAEATKAFETAMPGGSGGLAQLLSNVYKNTIADLVAVSKDAIFGTSLNNMSLDADNVEITTTGAPSNDDAVIMNDGVVQFNPRDKFMKVNDSTMIAGTNVDGNRRLARQLSGGGGISDNQISRLATAIASALKETLPTVKMSVVTDQLYAANKLNRGRYS